MQTLDESFYPTLDESATNVSDNGGSALQSSRIHGQNAPALPAPRHPILLVAVVTCQIVDFRYFFDVDGIVHHVKRQVGSDGQILKLRVIRNLVYRCDTIRHKPNLCRRGFSVYVS